MRYGAVIIVYLLTACATSVAVVSSPKLSLIALSLDVIPFVASAVAAFVVAVQLRRLQGPQMRIVAAIYGYFAGCLIGALGCSHLVAITILSAGKGDYDFHFYSLLLLGVLLLVGGFLGAVTSYSLASGKRTYWRASLTVWLAILIINLPLVPLQGFAVLLSVLATIGVLLLAGTRRLFAAQPAEAL